MKDVEKFSTAAKPSPAATPKIAPSIVSSKCFERYARTLTVRVRLPASVDPGSAGTYPDLRVVDDRDVEVPYVLDAEPRSSSGDGRSLQTSDVGFVKARFTEATLDMGSSGEAHDGIKLETSEQMFFVPVEVASSDDRATWRTLRRDALIYRVSRGGAEDTVVRYPASRARWLRVRILEPRHSFDVQGASLVRTDGVEPERVVRLHIKASPQSSERPNEQTWLFDGGGPNIGAVAIAFEATQATFERNVSIQASDDGVSWYGVSTGKIARFANGEPSVRIPFSEVYARKFRGVVDNHDDRPVTGLVPRLYGRQHCLVFRAEPARKYRLIWGNPAATAPEYDLGAKLEHEDWHATAVELPVAPTAAKSPFVQLVSGRLAFSGALLACCVVLGALTLRALKAS